MKLFMTDILHTTKHRQHQHPFKNCYSIGFVTLYPRKIFKFPHKPAITDTKTTPNY